MAKSKCARLKRINWSPALARAAAMLALAASSAFASGDVSYSLRISENLNVLKNPNDPHAKSMAAWKTPSELEMERNHPYLCLLNTSTTANGGTGAALLQSFTMTIGDTSQNFDFAKIISADPGVTATLITPDALNGGANSDTLTYSFTGLTPGKKVIFQIDIDPDSPSSNPFRDYREVLFTLNGGANSTGNSQTSATFIDPSLSNQTQTTPFTPWENPIDAGPAPGSQLHSFQTNDHVSSFQTVGASAVPEPATLLLAAIGAVGMTIACRRSKRAANA
jgi:hypothetical protein